MDKLKYIKLENEDGSYSDSIPLAVDSDHVDVNGTNLTTAIALKANASDVSASINDIAADLDLQTARIDNLAHLEEGSTTGDAELIDARVGFDGWVYANAGDATRGTTNDIAKEIFDDFDWDTVGYNYGFIESNGAISNDPTEKCVLSNFYVSPGDRFYLDDNINYAGYYILINNDFTKRSREVFTSAGVTIPDGVSGIAICIKRTAETVISVADLKNVISHVKAPFYYHKKEAEKNKEIELSIDIFNKWKDKTNNVITQTKSQKIGNCHNTGGYYHAITRSTSPQLNNTVYSEIFDVNDGSVFVFDNTKYKGLVVGYTQDDYSDQTPKYASWDTSGVLYPSKWCKARSPLIKYYTVEFRTVDDHSFTKAELDAGVIRKVISSETPFVDKDYVSSSTAYDPSLLTSGYYVGTNAIPGTNWKDALIANENSIYYVNAKKLNNKVGFVKITTNYVGPVSSRLFGFCDINDIVSKCYIEKDVDWQYNISTQKYEFTMPIVDTHFFFSFSNLATDITIEEIYDLKTTVDDLAMSEQQIDNNFGKALYIAPNGNDENDGSLAYPLATIDKALEKGANRIFMKAGIYTLNSAIDLHKATVNNKEISLINIERYNKVILRPQKRTVATSESLVDGYTKVYTTDETYFSTSVSSNNNWIFQKNVDDVTTLISDEERHPCERGLTYRCGSTKIVKTTAATLEDALTEIENATVYKWFFDNTNKKFYFSRPHEVTSEYPIEISIGQNLFSNANKTITLNCVAIETDGLVFNINDTRKSKIVDCAARDVYSGGGFTYDGAIGAELIRCEASRVHNGSTGDGFNGHATNSGEIYSKQTVVELRDCWSHDNNDDGYSDHERSEVVIRGGLYEYNCKGGITPSYGSHCSCFNVYSRNNYAGFHYVGAAAQAEGGKYGQMICYNCVAENNRRGGTKAGFRVANTENNMILVNCKSINNEKGFDISSDAGTATLIDCGSLNNDTVLSGTISKYIIKNTELVTLE